MNHEQSASTLKNDYPENHKEAGSAPSVRQLACVEPIGTCPSDTPQRTLTSSAGGITRWSRVRCFGARHLHRLADTMPWRRPEHAGPYFVAGLDTDFTEMAR
jgi:hypothetical protein